jgi:hypothetical protein
MCCQCHLSNRGRSTAYGLGEEEVVVFRLHSQVLEYRVGPEAFHKVLRAISILPCPFAGFSVPSCLSDHA